MMLPANAIADFEVYDVADVRDAELKPQSEIVTFISADPFTLSAPASEQVCERIRFSYMGIEKCTDRAEVWVGSKIGIIPSKIYFIVENWNAYNYYKFRPTKSLCAWEVSITHSRTTEMIAQLLSRSGNQLVNVRTSNSSFRELSHCIVRHIWTAFSLTIVFSDDSAFPGFSIQPNTPIISMVVTKKNRLILQPSANFSSYLYCSS